MKQIHSWQELSELEPSKTHYLEINLKHGCGRVKRISNNSYEEYLSTHTFYGYGVMEYVSEKLQECGFDVELIGWDKEPSKKVALDVDRKLECNFNIAENVLNDQPHFDFKPYSWHEHQKEFGISKKQIYKPMKIRRKK